MPKNSEIKKVLILGSGPITIGQACEFDYSGTQACRALKEEGIEVVLLNSNPATIMTDPGIADRTYIEPLDPMSVVKIIRKEGVDTILPTMGGQTGLNLMMAISKIENALQGVKVIGANQKSIHLAEDRRAFRKLLETIGLDSPKSDTVRSIEEAEKFADYCDYPFILRPSFTLGGEGQSVVYNASELETKVQAAVDASPIGEVLCEESVSGWKEFELEVMRDCKDNAIVVCGIENVDPMGVHTGDSITVAPIQSLTDREYQIMRMEALTLVRKIGVETGGCNVQFAVDPKSGRRIVIEMNPRVSRSSALASKATGFPIAYVATKLALGYSLDEIDNVITQSTKACFEPTIDYLALKIPRWHFQKFPGAEDILGPQMQSVGEVLSLGLSFGEVFHKALNSLEQKWPKWTEDSLVATLKKPNSLRSWAVWDALAKGHSIEELVDWTGWDPWFLERIKEYQEQFFSSKNLDAAKAKSLVDSPAHYPMVDTCAAEIPAKTPFFYSTRESEEKEIAVENKYVPVVEGKKGRVVILGSGPNRIGQGIEFDYCCVHASLVLNKLGYESVMVNCNPETVSTDPQISTRLYLEPLHPDSVKSILERELDPIIKAGKEAYVLVQMGGQTPLSLAQKIEEWGYKILGTPTKSIDLCEDRSAFADYLEKLEVNYPAFAAATDLATAEKEAQRVGYPVLVRPSFVLGGRGMKICSSKKELQNAFDEAKNVSEEYPLYLDKFLMRAVEFDVDGICDGKKAWVAGVMEHVEEAGVHSGDSSCVIPPFRLPPQKIDEMAGIAKKIALNSGAKGLFNIQMAVLGEQIFVLEANPRASRTVPYLAKATGYPVIEWAIRSALGEPLEEILKEEAKIPGNYRLPGQGFAVKIPVFPFSKFKKFDPILSPEMRSTGEVMGIDQNPGAAFAKAFLAAGVELPVAGRILFSVKDGDKPQILNVARMYHLMGFKIVGTPGTARYLKRAGIVSESVDKIGDGSKESLLDWIRGGHVQMIINTTEGVTSYQDSLSIRQVALKYRVPLMTTISAADMALMAIQVLKEEGIRPTAIQDFCVL